MGGTENQNRIRGKHVLEGQEGREGGEEKEKETKREKVKQQAETPRGKWNTKQQQLPV